MSGPCNPYLDRAGFSDLCDCFDEGTADQATKDLADAALETGARAVLISSLNGEADHWCRDFRRHFRARGLDDILLYIGGNLMIGDRNPDEVEVRFRGYGFDRVFHRTTGFGPALKALVGDLRETLETR